MLADFLTKPLQGALFQKFCDMILGYTHVSSLVPAPLDQERVGSGSDTRSAVNIKVDGNRTISNVQDRADDTWVEVASKRTRRQRKQMLKIDEH
jgi:hypothetical protein